MCGGNKQEKLVSKRRGSFHRYRNEGKYVVELMENIGRSRTLIGNDHNSVRSVGTLWKSTFFRKLL